MPKQLRIPADLRRYLSDPNSKRKFTFTSGEIRKCTLKELAELSESTFDVVEPDAPGVRRRKRSEIVRHEFTGIDLIKECNSYQPEGILVWLLELGMYGSWDCDHHTIRIFPHADWSEICNYMRRYVNDQWCPGIAPLSSELRPWE